MKPKQKYTITDGAFKALHAEVVALHGCWKAMRQQKERVIQTVKQACAKQTERDPRMVEALCVIFVELFGTVDVRGTTKSGMTLDCRNGSPASQFWRVVVKLMPAVRKVRAQSTTVPSGKLALREFNKLKKRLALPVRKILGALLLA